MGCDSALLLMQQKRSKLVFLRVAWIIDDGIGGGAKGVPQSRLGYWGIGRGKCPSSLSLFYLSYSRWPDVSLTPCKSLPACCVR
jgi:hypothetical protein